MVEFQWYFSRTRINGADVLTIICLVVWSVCCELEIPLKSCIVPINLHQPIIIFFQSYSLICLRPIDLLLFMNSQLLADKIIIISTHFRRCVSFIN